jgi:hypothetical protein
VAQTSFLNVSLVSIDLLFKKPRPAEMTPGLGKALGAGAGQHQLSTFDGIRWALASAMPLVPR